MCRFAKEELVDIERVSMEYDLTLKLTGHLWLKFPLITIN